MSQIAARIRALREQAYFSQQRLSKALGIAQSSLCRYETGETEPSAAVLLKYADFFDVSMDYIFGRTDDPHGAAPVRKSVDEPELEEFIEMCFDPNSSVNAKLKDALLKLLEESQK